jgi:hypothetical protein
MGERLLHPEAIVEKLPAITTLCHMQVTTALLRVITRKYDAGCCDGGTNTAWRGACEALNALVTERQLQYHRTSPFHQKL